MLGIAGRCTPRGDDWNPLDVLFDGTNDRWPHSRSSLPADSAAESRPVFRNKWRNGEGILQLKSTLGIVYPSDSSESLDTSEAERSAAHTMTYKGNAFAKYRDRVGLMSYKLKRETLYASGVNGEVKQQKKVKYTEPNSKERELTILRVLGSPVHSRE